MVLGVWKTAEIEVLNEFQFLTAKPVVYLVNLSEKDFIRQKNKWLAKIATWVKDNNPGPVIPYSAKFEMTLAELPDETARAEYIKVSYRSCEVAVVDVVLLTLIDGCDIMFMYELVAVYSHDYTFIILEFFNLSKYQNVGAQKSMLDKIITTGYHTLRLVHYFTCGEDEVKCWTIREGTKAPQAAGQIHTDFEKGFICADVYKYTDMVEHKSEVSLKAAGKLQQKG